MVSTFTSTIWRARCWPRLTSSPSHGRYPLWTPDSQLVVFYSDAGGGGLYSMPADGTGLAQTPHDKSALCKYRPPGPRAVERSSSSNGPLTALERRIFTRCRSLVSRTATPLVQTAANGRAIRLFRRMDGGWRIRRERPAPRTSYVRPFPQVDSGRWRISTDGGHSPVWSRDGRQLFFISRGRAMSVPIETAPPLRPGTPTVMFDLPPFYGSVVEDRKPVGPRT